MNVRRLTILTLLSALLALPLAAQETRERRRARVIVGGDEITVVQDDDEPRFLVATSGAYLGVSTTNLTPELREHFNASDSGVLVARVFEDTPAAKAGLRAGDVITRVDDQAVSSSWDLSRALRSKEKGASVAIEYVRDRSRLETRVTLEERKGPLAWNVPLGELPQLPELERTLEAVRVWSDNPDFKRRFVAFGECGSLREQIADLEKRLKDLEKRLQK